MRRLPAKHVYLVLRPWEPSIGRRLLVVMQLRLRRRQMQTLLWPRDALELPVVMQLRLPVVVQLLRNRQIQRLLQRRYHVHERHGTGNRTTIKMIY
jgi:hypothetical protein